MAGELEEAGEEARALGVPATEGAKGLPGHAFPGKGRAHLHIGARGESAFHWGGAGGDHLHPGRGEIETQRLGEGLDVRLRGGVVRRERKSLESND